MANKVSGYGTPPIIHLKSDDTDPTREPSGSRKRHYTIERNTIIPPGIRPTRNNKKQGLSTKRMKREPIESSDSTLIKSRLRKESDFPRFGGWVRVPFEGKVRISTTLEVKEETAKVKILDSNRHPRSWRVREFRKADLEPPIYHCAKSLTELMKILRETGTLHSANIEEAFHAVDRKHFCPKNFYWDAAIDIGFGVCISTPHMHIWVLEMLKGLFDCSRNILDIGSGSGHLTALFAHLAPNAKVIGVDIIPQLIDKARLTVQNHVAEETRNRIIFKVGDGELGYDSGTSYDIIHVGFMCASLPASLVDQLSLGGKMIVPIGTRNSYFDNRMHSGYLTLVEKDLNGKVKQYPLFWCSYVPSQSPSRADSSGGRAS